MVWKQEVLNFRRKALRRLYWAFLPLRAKANGWWVKSRERSQLFSFILLQPGRWWDPSRNLSALYPAAVLLRNVHNGDAKIHMSAGVSSVSPERYLHLIYHPEPWGMLNKSLSSAKHLCARCVYLHTTRMDINVSYKLTKEVNINSKCIRTLISLNKNCGRNSSQFIILPLLNVTLIRISISIKNI